MSFPLFQSFYPTAVKWINAAFRPEYRLIVDNRTGAPVGIQSPNANGPEGIWAPTPLTLAQIETPTAAILADLNATYQYDTAPYTRYYSDGAELVAFAAGAGGGTVIPAGQIWLWVSPLQITEAGGPLRIEGGLRLIQ